MFTNFWACGHHTCGRAGDADGAWVRSSGRLWRAPPRLPTTLTPWAADMKAHPAPGGDVQHVGVAEDVDLC
ncbi:MAG: hypothetical protein R2851_10485 [Caldilineaceae bacterium]